MLDNAGRPGDSRVTCALESVSALAPIRIRFPAAAPKAARWLALDEIHLWAADLDQSSGRLESLERLLSADERKRAASFRLDVHRIRFVAARAILRRLLASYLRREPAAIRFQYTSRGKPELIDSGAARLRFSVAHSDALALFAFAWNIDIGVDVECLTPAPDAIELAERFFSESERAALIAHPPSERHEAFYRGWTRKEAFLKAIGAGVSELLNCFDVSLGPGDDARLLRIDGSIAAAEEWSLHETCPADGFIGAVANASRFHYLRCHMWSTMIPEMRPPGALQYAATIR